MGRYDALGVYLSRLSVSEWRASFADIEKIIGRKLPDSARNYPAWWANQSNGGHSQSQAWQGPGWQTRDLDLASEKVTFYKFTKVTKNYKTPNITGAQDASDSVNAQDLAPPTSPGMTIAQAKDGLARTFGVPVESIEIIIKG